MYDVWSDLTTIVISVQLNISSYAFFQHDVIEPPKDLPDVVNDFDIEEDEVAIENRYKDNVLIKICMWMYTWKQVFSLQSKQQNHNIFV